MFGPNSAVVGVGINVSNDPIQGDAALSGHTINLHALLASKPTVNEVASLVLASLRRTHAELDSRGFAHLADAINRHWDRQRSVELTLNTAAAPIRGEFQGIDAEGRLIVRTLEGAPLVLEASQVGLLRELD
jgi:biotin-(acetyl-CoA carboxylase) ligase